MEDTLTILYSFIPLVSLIGYLPQIRVLLVQKEKASSISLSSWYLWLFMSVVSLGYGVFCLHDVLFSMTSAMNLLGCLSITLLVLYRRSGQKLLKTVRA